MTLSASSDVADRADYAEPPLKSRPFLMGISSMGSGLRRSEGNLDQTVEEWSRIADLTNLFFHVRWNALQDKPLLDGHEWLAAVGDAAREHGLKLAMVFDFTHDGRERDDVLAGVGLINKPRDGTPFPPEMLDSPLLRAAFQSELLAIVDRVKPEYVFIGLEINIFLYRCEAMWPGFVEIYKSCYDAIKAAYPATDVSVYTAGVPDRKEMGALRLLLPKLDSVAYSIYCDKPWELPDGYLTRVRGLNPDLPLFIPEFGVRTYDGVDDEDDQRRALHVLLEAFGAVETEAVVWCHLYDQDFTGGPDWFKEAFETIGLRRRDGAPKPAHELWKRTFALPPTFRDLWRVLLEEQEQSRKQP